MKSEGIAHGAFTLKNLYPVRPERVYRAWINPDIKARWFTGPEDWDLVKRELDVSVGGIEILHGRLNHRDLETIYTARYHAIDANQRMVYVYDMHLNGVHHSVSLATVEFIPREAGTSMVYNEQIAFLDGTDGVQGTDSRKRGTSAHFERFRTCLD